MDETGCEMYITWCEMDKTGCEMYITWCEMDKTGCEMYITWCKTDKTGCEREAHLPVTLSADFWIVDLDEEGKNTCIVFIDRLIYSMSIIFIITHTSLSRSLLSTLKKTSSNTFKPYIKLCYEPVKITHYPGYFRSGSSWTYNFWQFFSFFYIINLFTFADIYICLNEILAR